nr:hypothetical protein [uncultured Campylobacter sp.]
MRAFDLNFARAARIFDPNFMRAGRKAARPRGKIPSGARVLRGDEILNGGGILSGLALNVGKIPSGSGIFSSGEIWSDSKILNGGEILRDCEILSGSGILNKMSRGGTRRGFCRWILRELRAEASPLRLLCKFQSVSGSQTYKFKRATALQTDRKFKMVVSLRVACKFKTPMQEFHRESCAAVELLRQKSSSETALCNRLKFQSQPYALARLKFQGVLNAITRLKFQSAAVAEFARSKFRGLPRAAQRRKIRAQGQGG